jgi:hypothetical protein
MMIKVGFLFHVTGKQASIPHPADPVLTHPSLRLFPKTMSVRNAAAAVARPIQAVRSYVLYRGHMRF